MAHAEAIAYAEAIVRRSKVLLSINHEVNPDKVGDLAPLARLPMMRFPYWMRKGYAEEQYFIVQPKRSLWSSLAARFKQKRDVS